MLEKLLIVCLAALVLLTLEKIVFDLISMVIVFGAAWVSFKVVLSVNSKPIISAPTDKAKGRLK